MVKVAQRDQERHVSGQKGVNPTNANNKDPYLAIVITMATCFIKSRRSLQRKQIYFVETCI